MRFSFSPLLVFCKLFPSHRELGSYYRRHIIGNGQAFKSVKNLYHNMNANIQFELVISEPKRYYEGGDIIRGHVFVSFSEATKIRGIDLRFLGQANVEWIEKKRSNNDSRSFITKTYKNRDTYFDLNLLLFGRGEDEPGEDEFHPMGERRYSFEVQFPYDIPSSFDGAHGNVTYTLSGLLDIPWAPDKSFKKKIKVFTPLDLNKVQKAKDSVTGFDTKTLCCLCCAHGPITCEVSLVKAGYVPGENIYVHAHIVNNSRRKIARTEVVLKQYVLYRSSGSRTKFSSKELRTLVDEHDILKGGEYTWENEPLLIPKCTQSFLLNCRVIDVRYELLFKIDIVGTAMDMEMPIEIIVGNIPFIAETKSETQKVENVGEDHLKGGDGFVGEQNYVNKENTSEEDGQQTTDPSPASDEPSSLNSKTPTGSGLLASPVNEGSTDENEDPPGERTQTSGAGNLPEPYL